MTLGRPQSEKMRSERILEIARGERRVPARPTSPCPRCGGPWMRDERHPNDTSGIDHFYHCFMCGEVHYGSG
jgi:hypothetical protein